MIRMTGAALLIGAILGLWLTVGPELMLHLRAKHWAPGEATLVDVIPARESRSGLTEVSYRYQARGELLESRRLFLSERWRPISGPWLGLEKRLETNLAIERPMRLWFDPAMPSEAVLFRELAWEGMRPYFMAAALAASLGVGLLGWSFRRKASGHAPITASAPPDVMAPVVKPPRASDRGMPTAPSPVTGGSPAVERHVDVVAWQGGWAAELRVPSGSVNGVEAVTLDRMDARGILRWQDALPVHMLASRPTLHARVVLPNAGDAMMQAREFPEDVWQVTWRVRTPDGAERWTASVPGDWWRRR